MGGRAHFASLKSSLDEGDEFADILRGVKEMSNSPPAIVPPKHKRAKAKNKESSPVTANIGASKRGQKLPTQKGKRGFSIP